MAIERANDTLERAAHSFAVRVYYEDTDAIGVVYHSNYLRFAERARTEMLRCLELQQSRLWEEQRIGFVMRRCIADFFAPARLDDALVVSSRLVGLRAVSLDLVQTILRDDLELVRMQVKLACIGVDGRPKRIPAPMHAELCKLSGESWGSDGKQRS